jgi:hypothetical protein
MLNYCLNFDTLREHKRWEAEPRGLALAMRLFQKVPEIDSIPWQARAPTGQ